MSWRKQCALLLLILLTGQLGFAQVFRVQGGVSTLLGAEGGSVEVKAPTYDGSLGVGLYNGKFEFGAQSRYLLHDYTVIGGDDTVPFTLPTDIFDASHYFSARGLGAERLADDRRIFVFAGTTSTWLGTGFFNAATSDAPVGILFYERRLNKQFRLFSRDILSHRQTLLQGLEWKPLEWLKADVTGGTGSNQKYFASTIDAETKTLAVKAGYIVTGNMFSRVTVISPLSSEANKGNVQVLYKPSRIFGVTAGHENILQPLTPGGVMEQATVNHVSADFRVEKFYFGTGLFTSDASTGTAQGTNLYGGRRFGQRLDVNVNWFESKPLGTSNNPGLRTTLLSGTIRENISPRLSLLQLVSRTAGQTTYSFGGDFTSNRLQASVSYQNVYLPFRPDRPFEQALSFNGAFRVVGPIQLAASSNVDPNGHIGFSFGASTYLYRIAGMAANATSADRFSIGKYLVQGIVVDDQGSPVEGAALHIAKEIAYTDSSGHFMVRFSKRKSVSFLVAINEFTSLGNYAVISAPEEVRPDAEEHSEDVRIVLRKIPPPKTVTSSH